MAEIGFIKREEFFIDDIISDGSLMKTLASLSYSWNVFSFLKKSYKASSQKARRSGIKAKLQEVDSLCRELVDLLKKSTALKTLSSMNVSLLSQTYIQKLAVIKDIVFKTGQLNLKISDSILLTDLRRRIKQQQEKKLNSINRKPDELHECFCYNNSSLTWEETFDNIINMENS